MSAVDVRNLVKVYAGTVQALAGIDLQVEPVRYVKHSYMRETTT